MKFQHLEELDQGVLLYYLYSSVDKVIEAVESHYAEKEIKNVYIGYENTSADIVLMVNGIPAGQEMDEIQVKYFEMVT